MAGTAVRSRRRAGEDVSGAPAWGRIGAGVGAAGAPGLALWVHPLLGVILAVIEITVPVMLAIAVAGVAVFGSEQASERVFRLLRWIANRPEPPQ